jgi:alpha-L-arabinofuranosidase
MGLDEYIAFCRKVNSELMVAVNIRSGKEFNMHERSLDEAKRLLTFCKEKQYNVKFWYIGNEGYAKGFSALKYAEYIDMYADVLKSVDPNIKIVADWKMGPYKKNRFQESIDVAKASKSIDVMEFHEKWGNVWGLKSGFTMEEWRNELPIYNSKLTTLIRRFKEEMQKDNKKDQSWI